MSQNSCCVPGCPVTKKDDILHRFPNPKTNTERFNTWMSNIGGEITKLDAQFVFGNRRVCHKHFEEIHKYPNNRLCRLAVPVLHIVPEQPNVDDRITKPSLASTSMQMSEQPNVDDRITKPSLASTSMQMSEQPNVDDRITKPSLASTSMQMSEQPNVDDRITKPSLASTSMQMSEQPNVDDRITKPSLASTSMQMSEQPNVDDRITKPNLASTSMQMSDHPKKRPREVHVVKEIKQERSKTTKSKGPRVSLAQHKIFKVLLKQLQNCETSKINLKRKYMLARKMTKTEAFKIVSKHMTKTAKIFCQMQVFQSGKKKRGRRFSLDEKIMALSLYKPSPKAYRLLSNICVLPSRRTLQNLLHKINLKPGINDFLFEHLKQKVEKIPETHKYCSLMFDEMAIAPGVCYDKKNDQIKGLVDNGATIKNEYCDHVLVFMVRGIVKKYKQPLAYYFCSGSTKAIDLKAQIKEIITALQQTGLKVVTTVCDQGASNVAAINLLLKETKEKYLRTNRTYKEGFFKIGNEKIFPLYDPPHLIKGIRNNLITKNLKYVMNAKECTAKWDHIVALYKRSPGYRGVKLVPKLSSHHVFPEQIPKMRVKHCTQVFSKSVGVALGCMAELGALKKESTETADLLMFFDDLFDSVNGSYSQVKNGKIYRSAVTPTSPHHKLWDYSIKILKSMKFIDAKSQGVVPSLLSWIKTIENIQRVVKYLNSKGVNSLLLRNFNQDPLENFFGAIRAHGHSNVMPTAAAFEAAFKTLLINNITSSHSVGSNCEKDDSGCLQSLKFLLMKHGDKPSTECEDEINSGHNMEGLINPPSECEIDSGHLNMEILNVEKMLQSKSPADIEKSAAIGYCSGWIAHQAKKNIYKNCAVCQNDLESDKLLSFHQYIKAKEYDNKKWLCYPTRALFDFFAQAENICMKILKKNANKKNLLDYIKLILTINLNSFLACSTHRDILLKYLIDKSSIFFVNNWCKEVSGILTGKSPVWDSGDDMKGKAYRHYSKNKGRKRKRQD